MNGAVTTIMYSLWLPVLVLIISLVRFGVQGIGHAGATDILWLFALTWPAAIPLTWAVRGMHRHSPLLACGCAAVLGLAAAWGAIVGGLLGPVGVVAWALVAALPAWIILKVLEKQGSTGGTAAQA